MTVHTETIDKITYTVEIEQDDISVRGNAMASGDDDEDTQVEDEIIERLDNGDVWAWATVKVTASLDVETEEEVFTFEGTDYLGACSYKDTKDFLAGGYYEDMKSEAHAAMLQDIAGAVKRGEIAKSVLVGAEKDTSK